MSSRRTNKIEVLSEQLESLQITEDALSNSKQIDTEMSGAPAPANENILATMSKSMVLDWGWFDSNWMKFKDW